MKRILKILKAITINSIQNDFAYIANGWGNIISVVFYMATNVFLINVIFLNVDTIAGYSKDEILLFNLISQIWVFILLNIFFKNFVALVDSVNNGELDLILTKPVPSLLYVGLRNIFIINMFRDFIPSILIVGLAINWSTLSISIENLLFGVLISILGMIASISVNFILTLPVFWLGQNQGITDLGITIEDQSGHSNFVYEAWDNKFQFIFTIIFPSAINSAIATSVMLGKSNGLLFLVISILIAIAFILFSFVLWRIALRNYTSASS